MSLGLTTALMIMAHMEGIEMSERKRYVVNLYGPEDDFLAETSPRSMPKIGAKVYHDGEWMSIWYVEDIGNDIFNVRLERDIDPAMERAEVRANEL